MDVMQQSFKCHIFKLCGILDIWTTIAKNSFHQNIVDTETYGIKCPTTPIIFTYGNFPNLAFKHPRVTF